MCVLIIVLVSLSKFWKDTRAPRVMIDRADKEFGGGEQVVSR